MVIMTSNNLSTRGRAGARGQISDNAGICENIKPNCRSPFKFTSILQNLIIKKLSCSEYTFVAAITDSRV